METCVALCPFHTCSAHYSCFSSRPNKNWPANAPRRIASINQAASVKVDILRPSSRSANQIENIHKHANAICHTSQTHVICVYAVIESNNRSRAHGDSSTWGRKRGAFLRKTFRLVAQVGGFGIPDPLGSIAHPSPKM